MENVEQVYCKHTYPPEKIILFQAGVKYQVYSKCELSIVLISGAGGYLVTFNIGKPWLYGKPMFDEYFITTKELRKLKLKKISNGKPI